MTTHADRLAGYGVVSTALALLSDRRLGKLVDEAPVIGSGIGGTAVLLDIEETPVFVKRVPLTDLELRPENRMSTANLFRLPTFCQYGVGSPGGGAWREVAAPRFELSAAEFDFLDQNMSHDGCYTVTQLVNWLATALADTVNRADRIEFIRRCAEGGEPANVPEPAAAVIKRYAPVAVVMNEFYGKLYLESRTTPYPVDDIQRVCAATGFEPIPSIQDPV